MKKFLVSILLILSMLSILFLTGCAQMGETARKISGDLGDKAIDSNVFVNITKVTPSDPKTNFSPTIEQVIAMGRIKSIPIVAKDGELIKNYAEYRKTETPAWYNSNNVVKEEVFIATGDNVEELKRWYEERKKKESLLESK